MKICDRNILFECNKLLKRLRDLDITYIIFFLLIILKFHIIEKPDAPNFVNDRLTGHSSATVSWKQPYNGNSNISAYDVRIVDRFLNLFDQVLLNSTSLNVSGLVYNRYYIVNVRATNAQGTGNWSRGNIISTGSCKS